MPKEINGPMQVSPLIQESCNKSQSSRTHMEVVYKSKYISIFSLIAVIIGNITHKTSCLIRELSGVAQMPPWLFQLAVTRINFSTTERREPRRRHSKELRPPRSSLPEMCVPQSLSKVARTSISRPINSSKS